MPAVSPVPLTFCFWYCQAASREAGHCCTGVIFVTPKSHPTPEVRPDEVCMHVGFLSALRAVDQCTKRPDRIRAGGNGRLVWHPISGGWTGGSGPNDFVIRLPILP
jgi:hypothetical protein